MRSKFAFFGHPIHPMLVALPIGLFAWTFAADLIYLGTGKDQMWYDIAFWSGIAAIVTALIAALPGFGDYLTLAWNSDARNIGTFHMVLNLSVVGLYLIAMLLMLDNGALAGTELTAVVVLHALGAGLLGLAGWLGGEMVFRHHLAVIPDDREQEVTETSRHRTSGFRGGLRPR